MNHRTWVLWCGLMVFTITSAGCKAGFDRLAFWRADDPATLTDSTAAPPPSSTAMPTTRGSATTMAPNIQYPSTGATPSYAKSPYTATPYTASAGAPGAGSATTAQQPYRAAPVGAATPYTPGNYQVQNAAGYNAQPPTQYAPGGTTPAPGGAGFSVPSPYGGAGQTQPAATTPQPYGAQPYGAQPSASPAPYGQYPSSAPTSQGSGSTYNYGASVQPPVGRSTTAPSRHQFADARPSTSPALASSIPSTTSAVSDDNRVALLGAVQDEGDKNPLPPYRPGSTARPTNLDSY